MGSGWSRGSWGHGGFDGSLPENADLNYETLANGTLRDILADYNARRTEEVHTHLDQLIAAIHRDIEGSVTTLFGGSIKRHTAIDGLSDVDVLVEVGGSSLADATPAEALEYMAERIRQRLPLTDVKVGALAVTVTYHDGIQLQLLPALRTATGFRIADGDRWSNVICPERFAQKLTEVNRACNNNVVPVIKLFKGMQADLPKGQRLASYHVESLAIDIFRNYQGRLTYLDMLKHFVHRAAERVLRPIEDSSGQSVHVDDKLGLADSPARHDVAGALRRLSTRLEDIEDNRDVARLEGLFY